MPFVQPLFLPRPVVEANQINLENEFGYEAVQFTFAPNGRLLVLNHLFYNYLAYDHDDDRAFSSYCVNAYGPDLAPERLADFSQLYREADLGNYLGWDLHHPHLFVTPENVVGLTTQSNRTFLLDASLQSRRGQFGGSDPENKQDLYDHGFVFQAERTADGRLLCLVSEPGIRLRWFQPNLLCLSDGTALSADHRPTLTCLACLEANLRTEATFPHVRLADGRRAGFQARPVPSLPDQFEQRSGEMLYNPWLGQALPLDPGRCLVSLFEQRLRGGSKGLNFAFALVDARGQITGQLGGIDRYDESPFVEHHYRLAVDHAHRRIAYKNKTSVFLFDWSGVLLTQVKLDTAALKPLAAWKLGTCDAAGRLLLYQPKQRLLLLTDPLSSVTDLAQILTAGLEQVKKERTKLRKRYEAVGGNWLHPGPVSSH